MSPHTADSSMTQQMSVSEFLGSLRQSIPVKQFEEIESLLREADERDDEQLRERLLSKLTFLVHHIWEIPPIGGVPHTNESVAHLHYQDAKVNLYVIERSYDEERLLSVVRFERQLPGESLRGSQAFVRHAEVLESGMRLNLCFTPKSIERVMWRLWNEDDIKDVRSALS